MKDIVIRYLIYSWVNDSLPEVFLNKGESQRRYQELCLFSNERLLVEEKCEIDSNGERISLSKTILICPDDLWIPFELRPSELIDYLCVVETYYEDDKYYLTRQRVMKQGPRGFMLQLNEEITYWKLLTYPEGIRQGKNYRSKKYI